jgi:hypothetical protein
MRHSLSLSLLIGAAALAPHAAAQRFVSLDGTPGLTSIVAPPTATGPLCAPAGVCPVPLPAFGPGVAMPSFGGEAIDEVGGVAYASNGVLISASTIPGCVPGPVFPVARSPVRRSSRCATPPAPGRSGC